MTVIACVGPLITTSIQPFVINQTRIPVNHGVMAALIRNHHYFWGPIEEIWQPRNHPWPSAILKQW